MDYHYYDEPDYIDIADGDDNEAAFANYQHGLPSDFYTEEQPLRLTERLWDSYHNCMLPSLLQIVYYMAPLLLCCTLYRLLIQLYMRRRYASLTPLHLLSTLCGLVMLYVTLGKRLALLLALSITSYALLQLVRLGSGRRAAMAITVLTIGSQFLYELVIWRQPSAWPQLRGLQMVANMKVISLAHDLSQSGNVAQRMPSFKAFLGYIYCPATCVLGPWISFERYLQCLASARSAWPKALCQVLLNVLLCLISVSLSNCLAPALGELSTTGSSAGGLQQWYLMYTGALTVRSSHYFIGFLSQALLAASGQLLDDGASSKTSSLLGQLVARPWQIEWPRSLSALARNWDLPMHEWLKRYIYAGSGGTKRRSRSHTLLAVLGTYLVSSLLHGMDVRIYLVLLSLAMLASGETLLRRQLALLSDACISANPCAGAAACRFARCPQRLGWRSYSSWLVALVNLAFRLLAMAHLAYLGVVLLSDAENADNGPPILFHWSEAGYLSHYLGLGTFVLYLLIS